MSRHFSVSFSLLFKIYSRVLSRKSIYHLNDCLLTPEMKRLLIIKDDIYLMFNLFEVSVKFKRPL